MSRNWNPNVAKIVAEMEKMPGVTGCSTYPGHGATDTGVDGEPWGIDVQIATWGNYANKAQEANGDRIQKWVEANWSRLGIHYMIWWGWITYAPGAWQRYNPGSYNNAFASVDAETQMHMDHVHLQIHTNYAYKPPKVERPDGRQPKPPEDKKPEPAQVLWGIDIANYQAGIDMPRVKREGYDFCVVKATEGPYRDGTPYVNPEYTKQITQAKAQGLVVGAYHFLVETPAKPQVDLFLKTVGDVSGKIIMVDFEAYNEPYAYLTPTNPTLKGFIAELQRRIGDHPVVLYSGRGFWNGGEPSGPVAGYGKNITCWDAYYLYNDPVDPKSFYERSKELFEEAGVSWGWGKPWGDKEPKIWQFTPAGAVAGRNIDVNTFAGTRAELLALAGDRPTAQPPAPPPSPTAPVRIKPNLVAVGELDEEAAFAAAKVFRRRDFFVTVKVGRKGVRAFDETFAEEKVGTRQMIVVGGPARDALPPDSQKKVHNPWQPTRGDYIGAVGKGYPHTLDLLAGVLDARAGKGAGAEFRAVLEARVDAKDHETVPADEPDEESPTVTPGERRRKRASDGRRRDREEAGMYSEETDERTRTDYPAERDDRRRDREYVEVDSEEADGGAPNLTPAKRVRGRGQWPGGQKRDREAAEMDGEEADGSMLTVTRVKEALEYALQVVGAPYESWSSGSASRKQPVWAEDARPPESAKVKNTSCFCAGVTNLMLRAVDKEIPRAGIYSGGTLAYGLYYEDRAEPFDVNKRYPEGTLIGRMFRDAEDPGHVAVVLENGTLLQSYEDEVGGSRPGVNTDITVEDSHGEGVYEYAVLPQDWLE